MTRSKIKSSAITDGTIATGDIADDAITGVKLANDINIAGDLTVTGNDINTAGSMLLRPGGAEKMRVASDGNVGIGTASPDRILSISGGVGPLLKPSPFPPPGGAPHGL